MSLVGVLGGGIAGLAVAGHAAADCEVLEADTLVGGHCRSLVTDGYTFDLGGPHILFSRDQQILDTLFGLLGDNLGRRRRANKIWFRDRYVKYPFENGLGDLPPEDRYECLIHYLRNDHPPPANFREWILHNFGTGIAERYMIPYNEKIWKVPAQAMATDWVEGRVPKPPLEDVVRSAVGVETEGYVHQLTFGYPLAGGIEALPAALAMRCRRIVTGFCVRRVWREADGWHVGDGRTTRRYDRLVSTIPVQELIEALPDVPEEIRARAAALRFNSLVTVMLGLPSAEPLPFTAVYVPDPDIIFHRLSFPLAFTPNGAPAGHMAVTAEITANPGQGADRLSDEAVIERTLAGLAAMGIGGGAAPTFRAVHRTRYAYVVRTVGHAEHLAAVLAYVAGLGIVSVGRNAEFEYINMDEAVRRALVVARAL
ncbi:MAG: FAD-dependent oxidoreductase [Dongiaceae bacterium]